MNGFMKIIKINKIITAWNLKMVSASQKHDMKWRCTIGMDAKSTQIIIRRNKIKYKLKEKVKKLQDNWETNSLASAFKKSYFI
jgi:hypothetical protein